MSKTIAIMQPYIFPYIGYFQLISACDQFVLYDDVQWIRRGWINRNRILGVNGTQDFTFPVKKGLQRETINQKQFSCEWQRTKEKFLRIVYHSYSKSPNFRSFFPVVEDSLRYDVALVLPLIVNSLNCVCDYLQIETPRIKSSELELNQNECGQNRIISINKHLQANRYINPIGGQQLYDSEEFSSHGIELRFLKPLATPYLQRGSREFVPFLSIIDVAMNNSIDKVQEMLKNYELI